MNILQLFSLRSDAGVFLIFNTTTNTCKLPRGLLQQVIIGLYETTAAKETTQCDFIWISLNVYSSVRNVKMWSFFILLHSCDFFFRLFWSCLLWSVYICNTTTWPASLPTSLAPCGTWESITTRLRRYLTLVFVYLFVWGDIFKTYSTAA